MIYTVWRIRDPRMPAVSEHRVLSRREPLELREHEVAEAVLEFALHDDMPDTWIDAASFRALGAIDFQSWGIAHLVYEAPHAEQMMWTGNKSQPVSSVRVEFTPAHAHVRAWNRGAFAGELTIERKDWPHLVRMLGFDPEQPTAAASQVKP